MFNIALLILIQLYILLLTLYDDHFQIEMPRCGHFPTTLDIFPDVCWLKSVERLLLSLTLDLAVGSHTFVVHLKVRVCR